MTAFDFSPFEALLQSEGLALVEASLSSDIKTAFASWTHDRICLVKRGLITLDFVDGETKLSEGALLYLPARVKHRWVTAEDGSAALFMLCYDRDFFDKPPRLAELLSGFGSVFPGLSEFSSDSTIRAPTIRYLFHELIKEKRVKAPDQKMITLTLFMTLVTQLLRCQREIMEQEHLAPREQSFSNSLKYLEENIQEKIGITELAALAGLSYRRYAEVFKEKTGMTANQYIRSKRIALAQQLLAETGNILHASLDAGFGDLTHFYRVFKQHTGLTPKQFVAHKRAKPH